MENQDKRAAIMHSTVRTVAEYGFHGATMAVIASHAGVGAGTIYLYFESKERLIEETYRKVEARLLAAAIGGYPSRGSVRQRLCHLAHKLLRHGVLFPAEFLFIDQFQSSPYRNCYRPAEPAASHLRTIVQLFREGAETGLFKSMEPEMLLALACGPLVQALRAHAAGAVRCDAGLITGVADSCWDLLCRRAS